MATPEYPPRIRALIQIALAVALDLGHNLLDTCPGRIRYHNFYTDILLAFFPNL
ncbi:hypothetical protein ACQR1I_29565 [Bradyrhizobium sp. HKCCYLS2038]|uniref:hypothetical protein n=1 Tax=unclassified Bradyrhizobium TaxID=2631580 RepID=UPI003EBCA6C0